MKQYEKDLKIVQSKNTRDNIVDHESIGIPLEQLRILAAKGFITLDRLYDNLLRVVITDEGLLYFANKKEHRLAVFATDTRSIITTAMASIITFLVGLMIGNG